MSVVVNELLELQRKDILSIMDKEKKKQKRLVAPFQSFYGSEFNKNNYFFLNIFVKFTHVELMQWLNIYGFSFFFFGPGGTFDSILVIFFRTSKFILEVLVPEFFRSLSTNFQNFKEKIYYQQWIRKRRKKDLQWKNFQTLKKRYLVDIGQEK
eukprot:TRINITY_DN50739_c0_g1_i16.p2 TRINITY_DN50739_c0_g1~~TRINITY_DN50739_c0_g1_i16.p2  ORF type:complete len:153 (+),score=13.74 TRINITY_DN50739_c0_g1_i16:3-461(+)